MSIFNRKTFLDNELSSLHVNGIFGAIGDVVGDVFGGITGADDAAEAAKEGAALSAEATLEGTRENIDFQKWLWGEQKDLLQPFATAGTQAISPYQQQTSQPFTIDDLYMDPGYQFGLNEGTKAIENSAASRGMQLSGATGKALTRFGTDYASTKYNEAFNRRQVGLDNLYRMIMLGSNAAAGQATTGTAMGSQVSSAINSGARATSDMYSDVANINAASEMSGWNTLMDIGNLSASFMGGK